MSYNYILGSGLVALLCRKVLGPDWKIIPLGPSRFYSQGVPAWGDDFIVYDDKLKDFFDDWGFDTLPLFFNRPLSAGGTLVYNDVFLNDYLNRLEISDDPIARQYFKTDFTVFGFSCIQLWNKLIKELLPDIKSFYQKHKNSRGIETIRDHKISIKTDHGYSYIEYDNLISTVPYHVLSDMAGIEDNNLYDDIYYYYIEDDSLDIEKANQVLVCDAQIPFHKCTKINNKRYLIEIIGDYYENIYEVLFPVLGGTFEIKTANLIRKGFSTTSLMNDEWLSNNNVTTIGSLAQCDPLMDIGSCLKRTIKVQKGILK